MTTIKRLIKNLCVGTVTFVIIWFVVTGIVNIFGNGRVKKSEQSVEQSRFEFIEELDSYGDTSINLVYDINTGIEYILIKGYGSVGICPHYDSDGTIMNYYDR